MPTNVTPHDYHLNHAHHFDLLRNHHPHVLQGARCSPVHAEHQSQSATFTFDGNVLAGSIQSSTALRLIRELVVAHSADLESNWERARAGESLEAIPPLD